MGRIANYLRSKLGISMLGQELGALRAMQLSFREREAKETAAVRLQGEALNGLLALVMREMAELKESLSKEKTAHRQLAAALTDSVAAIGKAQERAEDILRNADLVMQGMTKEVNGIKTLVKFNTAQLGRINKGIEKSAGIFEHSIHKRVVPALQTTEENQKKILGSIDRVASTGAAGMAKVVGTIEAHIARTTKLETQHLTWAKDVANMIGGMRSDMREGLKEVRGETASRLDRFEAGLIQGAARAQEHLARSAKTETQHLAWAKDTAQMIGEMRSEVRLLMNTPSGPQSGSADEEPESDDPKLLREYVRSSRIREIYPTELFQGFEKLSIPIASINEQSGHGNQVDLMYVAAIAKALKARNIFEFGTYIGRTTYHLTFASKDARVTTLNLPPEADSRIENTLGMMFRGTDRESRITQLLQDSALLDPSPYAGKMDFIFIDADHSYELVKNDTEKALVMLKPGGAMVWHDYAIKSPGVVRYIQEFSQTRPVFRIRHTCLIVYLDGVDAMAFQSHSRGEISQSRQPLVSAKRKRDRAGVFEDAKKAAAS